MLPGIDVSMYQGVIIWKDVRADGYEFSGIKATEGSRWRDPYFKRNWDRCEVRGVKRIAYSFFHPDLPGGAQADFLHSVVHDAGGFLAGDCAMLDMEETNGMSAAHIIQEAEAFAQRLLSTTKCGLYIYTNKWFWDGLLGSPRSVILGRCALWDASWGAYPSPISNWPHGASIWQWTEKLTVPGINGYVDGDRFLGTMQQYNTLAAKSGRE